MSQAAVVRYRLVVSDDRGAGREACLDLEAEVVLVGRAEDAAVRLPHRCVSLRHLELMRRVDGVYALDGGSSNGTWIGGQRLARSVARRLNDGDVIDVARCFALTYRAASPADRPTGARETAEIVRRLVRELLAAGDEAAGAEPRLRGERGAMRGRQVPLPPPGGRLILGRGEGCDVLLLDPALSREHVAIERSWEGVTVVDLGSKNGTQVDGRRIRSPTPVRTGALITVGACAFRLEDPAEAYLARLAALAEDEPWAESVRDRPAGQGAVPEDGPPAPTATSRAAADVAAADVAAADVAAADVAAADAASARPGAPGAPTGSSGPSARDGVSAGDQVAMPRDEAAPDSEVGPPADERSASPAASSVPAPHAPLASDAPSLVPRVVLAAIIAGACALLFLLARAF